jgi:hypothetical protein
MKTLFMSMLVAASVLTAAAAYAQTPAEAPAGSTGLCKDGTYYSGETKKGACKGHKGVKTWYGTADATPAAKAAAPTVAPATPATAPKPAAPAAAAPAPKTTAAPTVATAGAHPGDVWVNTSTKVYHCSGDKYYGKTKKGEYMSEVDAKTKGFHADHGKACQS